MNDKNHDSFFDEQSKESSEQQLLDMIEAQDKEVRTDFEAGTKVKGNVVSIGTDHVFVDIGGKHEAVISASELSDEEGNLTVKQGDEMEAFIISTQNDELVLSKSMAGHKASVDDLVEAMQKKIPVQGKVTGVNKGGFNVSVMGKKAFCPVSHIDLKYVEDPNQYLSKSLSFIITRITEKGRNIVLSRLPLLEDTLEERIAEFEKGAEEKKVFSGTITKITKFGLFVSLGEVEGLVHISEVSWDRAEKLEESFTIGQPVDVVILGVERKKPLRDSKISLSIRHVFDDPWSTVREKFTVGQQVEGTITRLTNFGAFVQLIPGVEGLIHVSEMRWGQRVRHASDVVSVGDRVKVTVLTVDEDKRAISCSLKDVSDDPWLDLDKKMPIGSTVKGTVASETRYGFFVDLAEGITGLLVHKNVAPDKKGSIKTGETIEVTVQNIDMQNRRISLAYGVEEQKADVQAAKEYMEKQERVKSKKGDVEPSSEFGALLKKALKNKE